jgi:phosphoglycolate phosphatase
MGSAEYIDAVLKRCNIRKYFDYVYPRQNGKTKSQVLTQLICNSGEQKANCVMIGDSITDLTAAKGNSVPFIGVSYGYGAKDIKDCVAANNIEELKGLINQFSIFSAIYSDIVCCNKPLIIGVNGVDTSGKTIFASNFMRFLNDLGHNTLLIHMDDFHNRRAVRMSDTSPRGYLNNAFNTALLGDLLSSIQRGHTDQTLELLDLDTDENSNIKRFAADSNTIVIVEGVLLYRPPLDQFFSYKIFLDIDFDEVLRRAALRDVPKYGEEFLEKYRNRYIPAQETYLDEYSPKTHCHMLIDNNDYADPKMLKM